MPVFLSQIPVNQSVRLAKIHFQGLDASILQECYERGFLPETEIRILQRYPSLKKVVVSLNETIKIALPYSLAEKMEVREEVEQPT